MGVDMVLCHAGTIADYFIFYLPVENRKGFRESITSSRPLVPVPDQPGYPWDPRYQQCGNKVKFHAIV